MNNTELKAKYQAAFDSFLDKVKADDAIIAAYLYGSLARGDVWEKSDLDVFLVTKDERRETETFALVEDDITFHCTVFSRSRFRQTHERLLRGSPRHQIYTSGKLVYTRDESLHDYFRDAAFVGERDREYLLLLIGIEALALIHDVQKALISHQDPLSGFIWQVEVVKCLAALETVSQKEIIQREVVQQALRLNPPVFEKLFVDLINGEKDIPAIQEQLALAEAYIVARAGMIFKPLLAFLAEPGDVVSASELFRYFNPRLLTEHGDYRLIGACEWLVERGILQRVSAPVKLTMRSRLTVDEPAYSYHGGKGHA
jgi:predicted nucleotidyltransferase